MFPHSLGRQFLSVSTLSHPKTVLIPLMLPAAEWNVRVTLQHPPAPLPPGGDPPVNPPLMTLSSRVPAKQARLVMTELRTRMPSGGGGSGQSPTLSQVWQSTAALPSEQQSLDQCSDGASASLYGSVQACTVSVRVCTTSAPLRPALSWSHVRNGTPVAQVP
jgi:hypothetical protein